jgi:hypothetical protein
MRTFNITQRPGVHPIGANPRQSDLGPVFARRSDVWMAEFCALAVKIVFDGCPVCSFARFANPRVKKGDKKGPAKGSVAIVNDETAAMLAP